MEFVKLREMGKDIRLVITDMDGTLLDSSKQISRRNREAIEKVRDRQIGFTICTGRIPTMIEYYVNTLDIHIPVVAANGAVVWDPDTKTPLYDVAIDPVQAEELMDFCRFHGMDYSALTLGASYFSRNSVRIKRFEKYNEIAEANGEERMRLEYLDDGHACLRDKKIYKMLIYELEPGQQELAEGFLEKLSGMAYTSSDAKLWDISASGINKGTGLMEAARIMGLEKKNVCAFGDFYNDVSLMETAGIPVAMGNGCELIKEKAIYVTKTNDEDGVADAIEKLLL